MQILGSRINAVYDLGYAALDLLHTYASDSGRYYAVITYDSESIRTQPVMLECLASAGVVTVSNLQSNSQGLNR